MATCLESINGMGSITSLTEVFPNTVTPFSVTSSANRLFRLQSPTFQTVRFSFNLTSNPWNTVFTVYRWQNNQATVIGSANINSAVVSFSMDFLQGDYIICVRPGTAAPQEGSLVAQFTGYSQVANLQLNVGEGATASANVTTPTKPRECNEALFFEILEGELPPGLSMDFLGTIKGWLPNLDCLEDSPSPAVNWYFTDNDGTAWPWGRQWRFRVRVWVDGMKEESNAEEWFCVKIHNNWTFDLENFIEQSPFEKVHEVRVVDAPPVLEPVCMPCEQMKDEVQFIPQPVNTECLPCQNPTEANRVDLVPIPTELAHLQPNEVVAWYVANKDLISDNPYINKFIQDLETSDVFQILLGKYGYKEENLDADLEYAVASNYQNYLQLAEIRLDPTMDPNNLAVLMAQWRDYMNQTLPTTGIGYSGEELYVNLT